MHMLYLAAAGLSLGLVLVVWGRVRGRRLDRHPVCRKCGYDLFGLAQPKPSACPECGADLARKRAIRIGNRRPIKRFMLPGLMLCGMGLGFGLTVGIPVAKAYNWYRPLPLWMVIDAAEDAADPPRAAGGQDAILRRHWQGKFSAEQYQKLVQLALAKQADRSIPWDPFWGDFIEHARHAGHVTDEQWQQYFTEGCRFEFTVSQELTGRMGIYYDFQLIGTERLARNRAGNVRYSAMVITEDGPVYSTEHDELSFVFTGKIADGELFNAIGRDQYVSVSYGHTRGRLYLLSLPPGRYTCRVTLAWYVSSKNFPVKHHEWIENMQDAPITSELDYEASFEVIQW